MMWHQKVYYLLVLTLPIGLDLQFHRKYFPPRCQKRCLQPYWLHWKLHFGYLLVFLEFGPDYSAYINRGIAKFNLLDFNGAIADYIKSIELNPSHAPTYYNRGIAKVNLGEFYDAILDFNKAIELNPNHAQAYLNRGIAKVNLEDFIGACKDGLKAEELGFDASYLIQNTCN